MSSLLIVRPLPIIAAAQQYASAANVLTPDPKDIFMYPGGNGLYYFYLDMGAAITADFLFAGFVSPGSYVSEVATGTDMVGGGLVVRAIRHPAAAPPASASARRRHAMAWLTAPAASRYWRIGITFQGGNASLGIMGLGLAIQPAYGREWGSGRQPVDMSSVQALRGGGYGIDRGARKVAYQFTCGDLLDAEVQALWDMAEEIGESAPVIVCEDPDWTAGLNERLHYGLFDRPEAYERLIPGQTRWAFRLRGWV
jgi:hypothetical protein